jgi:uncharacterized protein YigE (DUF2233 family)
MNLHSRIIFTTIVLLSMTGVFLFAKKYNQDDNCFISYTVNTKKQEIKLYWKDDKKEIFRSIQNLKSWLGKNNQRLLFAMNAGMYKQDNSPQGLFIENKLTVSPIDTFTGNGNFYLKPNGIFYIDTENIPFICNTNIFHDNGKIKYATQSGPMLLIDGSIHPAFKKDSKNLNVRNGVGILPGNKVVFALSKKEINFYDFASYFKSMGCKNALYLDGLVSRLYLPEKNWIQTGGNFGVIIGVTARAIK